MSVLAQLCFEQVAVGDRIPEIVRGPMTPMHIMRWSAAVENFHRIHYDFQFATQHDGLPNVLVNGSWKQHLLVQMLRNWIGEGGWLWKISYRFRRPDIAGDVLTAFGVVAEVRRFGAFGVVRCEIGIRNSRGEPSTEGGALIALPYRAGGPVPYPFPERGDFSAFANWADR